jgi:hypothetical protein
MIKPQRITRHGLAALLLVPLPALHAAEATPAKPNIILIMADDLGYAALAVTGGNSFLPPRSTNWLLPECVSRTSVRPIPSAFLRESAC